MQTLTVRGKNCPHCGSPKTRWSRRTLLEFFLIVIRRRPYRCCVCGIRFWSFA
jgi:hypothetical protein